MFMFSILPVYRGHLARIASIGSRGTRVHCGVHIRVHDRLHGSIYEFDSLIEFID